MDLSLFYLKWSSILFLIVSRLLSYSIIYIRIPTQFILSSFYLIVLYKSLKVDLNTIKYYENLQYCLIGIIWASFFILDMIRNVINIELYTILPIDIIFVIILTYTIFCREDNPFIYYCFIMFFTTVFLFQLNYKQSLIFIIMRDIFFYVCYHFCLNVFDIKKALSLENTQSVINILIKTVVCSLWILLYFFSQYYFPLYMMLLAVRMFYFNNQDEGNDILPTVSIQTTMKTTTQKQELPKSNTGLDLTKIRYQTKTKTKKKQ